MGIAAGQAGLLAGTGFFVELKVKSFRDERAICENDRYRLAGEAPNRVRGYQASSRMACMTGCCHPLLVNADSH